MRKKLTMEKEEQLEQEIAAFELAATSRQGLFVFFFVFLPLLFIEVTVGDFARSQQVLDYYAQDIFFSYRLLQGVEFLVLDYGLMLGLRPSKIRKWSSICLRLFAACYMIYGLLLYFGVIPL